MVNKEELVETSGRDRGSFGPDLDSKLKALPEQYEILGKISQGGMGAIFKAKNRYTGALVAIKVLKAEASRSEKALARFVLEARSASSLNHPRVCQVRDFGLTTDQTPYLVMDWINGITLSKKVQADGPQPPAEAITIFQQICAGLEHAHGNKVVHRDLKPDNILLTRDADGRTLVHIVDFGIAKVLQKSKGDYDEHDEHENESETTNHAEKSDGRGEVGQLTTTGTFVGTPLYMSPEQARASVHVDERSDIYSLGCLMYYVLSGEPPLVGESAIETIAKHLNQTPADFSPRLRIPADLRKVVFKCMEKKPDDRYQTMMTLATDLKKLSIGVNISRQTLVSERERRRKTLIRIGFFVLGFAVMYLLSLGVQNLADSSNQVGTTTSSKASPVQSPKEDTVSSKKMIHRRSSR
jgi:serine/threonine-protein kinase